MEKYPKSALGWSHTGTDLREPLRFQRDLENYPLLSPLVKSDYFTKQVVSKQEWMCVRVFLKVSVISAQP